MKRKLLSICLLLIISCLGMTNLNSERNKDSDTVHINDSQSSYTEKNNDDERNTDSGNEKNKNTISSDMISEKSGQLEDSSNNERAEKNKSTSSSQSKNIQTKKVESSTKKDLNSSKSTKNEDVSDSNKQSSSDNKSSESKVNSQINKNETSQNNVEKVQDYDIGNCGKLYDTEDEAYEAAEAMFNDFSDPDKYVSSYFIYSTYDKWSFSIYYSYY